MIITHDINMDLDCCGDIPRIDAAQGDANTRQVRIKLSAGGGDWAVPEDVQVLVRFRRSDSGSGAYDTLPDGSPACAVSGNVITAALMPQLFTAAGIVTADICLIRETAVLCTFPFQINVHPGAASWLAPDGEYHNVSGFVPMPEPAVEGQFIRVTEVDAYGIIQAAETAELDDASIRVPVNVCQDMTGLERTASRRSFHLGNPIPLGDMECYRISSLAIRADAGTTVRFALYAVDDENGVMTHLSDLGDAVANDADLALLTFAEGYEVTRDNTIILASAATETLHCYSSGAGITVYELVRYADGDYTGNAPGSQIPFTRYSGSAEGLVFLSLFRLDYDFLDRQRFDRYLRESGRRLDALEKRAEYDLPSVGAGDEGKILQAAAGSFILVEPDWGVSSWNDLADKPFYEEAGTQTLLPEQEVSGFSSGQVALACSGELVVGENYTVAWDGTEYRCTAFDVPDIGGVAIGNGAMAGLSDTGEPFIVGYAPAYGWICLALYYSETNGWTTYPIDTRRIGIIHETAVIKPLDAKYLPMEAIDARIDAYMEEALGGDY